MTKTIKLTAGEAIVRYLDNQYVLFEKDGVMTETKFVEGFYTIFGHGCVLGVGEALSQAQHSLTVYQGRNEQGIAQAATAYAKMHNRRNFTLYLQYRSGLGQHGHGRGDRHGQ